MSVENILDHGPWTASNSLTKLNELIDQVNDITRRVSERDEDNTLNFDGPRPFMLDIFVGLTTETPPYGSTHYTDARYWVTRAVAPDSSKANIATSFSGGSLIDGLTASPDPMNGHLPLPQTVTATNLSELPNNYGSGLSAGGGTHSLAAGTIVIVVGFPSRANPTQRTYFLLAVTGTQRVRVTTYDAAKGYYVGYLQQRKNSGFSDGNPGDFSDDVDLSMSDYYQDGPQVVLMNEAESKLPIPVLRTDGTTYVQASPAGTATDTFGRSLPCYACNVPATGIVCRIDHAKQNGVYTGVALYGVTDLAVTSDAAEILTGMQTGSVQCVIFNAEEIAVTGGAGPQSATGNRLAVGSYIVGQYMGPSADATPVPVIGVRGGVGRIDSPKDITTGTFSGGTWTTSSVTWDWASDGKPFTWHPVTGIIYDGSTNASGGGGAVTTGGSYQLAIPRRVVTVDARGNFNHIDTEPSIGSLWYIQLQQKQVVTDVSWDGTTLKQTKQTLLVVDFLSDATDSTIDTPDACP